MTYKFVISPELYNKIKNYKTYLERYGAKDEHATRGLQKALEGSYLPELSLEEFTLKLIGTVDLAASDRTERIENIPITPEWEILALLMNQLEDQPKSDLSGQTAEIILMVQTESETIPFGDYETTTQQVFKEKTADLGGYYHPFSPFAELNETTTYPHARSMRTSFKQKFIDSYYVLAGKMPILNKDAHFGLFDYITGFIPAALLLALDWSLRKEYWPIAIVLALINLPFVAVRVLFGVVTASLFSIVTGIVSIVTNHVAEDTLKEALELEGTLADGSTRKLSWLLGNQDLEKLDAYITQVPSVDQTGAHNSYALELNIKGEEKTFSSLGCQGCQNGDCSGDHKADFTVNFSTDNPSSNAKNLNAFFKLNLGGVVTSIEHKYSRLSDESKLDILSIK